MHEATEKNNAAGSGSSVESAEQVTGRSSSSASLSNSFVVVPEMGMGPPLVKFQFVSQIAAPESPKHAALAGEVLVVLHLATYSQSVSVDGSS